VGARAVAIIAVVVLGCAGPAPGIERVEVVKPQRPGCVRVELVVVNRSGGHGEVQIEILLRTARPGRMLTADRSLELDGHQRLELSVDIPAPEGDYVAEARAIYPD
jgi:hypothetical protein